MLDSWASFNPLGAGCRYYTLLTSRYGAAVDVSIGDWCGNCFILKPSERGSFHQTLFIAKLLEEAGLAKGVDDVVIGDKVAYLRYYDDRIERWGFVWVSRHGRLHLQNSSGCKRLPSTGWALESRDLMPWCRLDNAAQALNWRPAFGSSGERCMALFLCLAVGGSAADLWLKLKRAWPSLKWVCFSDSSNDIWPSDYQGSPS